jgi:hypothetical protein
MVLFRKKSFSVERLLSKISPLDFVRDCLFMGMESRTDETLSLFHPERERSFLL